jgi:hypothetical protein
VAVTARWVCRTAGLRSAVGVAAVIRWAAAIGPRSTERPAISMRRACVGQLVPTNFWWRYFYPRLAGHSPSVGCRSGEP